MSLTRVTHQMSQTTALANVQRNLAAMSKLQGQTSSLRRIEKPSDDPAGTAKALRLRAEQRALTQYDRNAADGKGWLTAVDTAMQTTSTQLIRARTLVVQAASSGTTTTESAEAIALEIEAVRDALLGQANATYTGRSIFAGTSDADAAYAAQPDGTYSYAGSAGTVDRRISEDVTVRVDADGAALFGDATGSVFALLDRVAADVRAGADVGPAIAEIDAWHNRTTSALATTGARTNQIEAQLSVNAGSMLSLRSDISAVEDVDLAETLVHLQAQEVAYQAALGATARVLQPTLLQYLS
ncbi:flagellar hook-associated protein FlgL [Sanguibacter sp. HDW7]|uniref:flagellar hook-associated protein FlgL n=1 Tax=Sanguibacter sp. HDW7 TaxID=2714931 RepID=UPI0014099147|nr:flagellar hook-associated protein FlgL [Sanguibacter sp. HDW7]QIK84319.1 flagellar hook-associated protein 3 [Sanguibacter sp. HDW7]